jgi:two-component system chemotaxis sensor kinase CheA
MYRGVEGLSGATILGDGSVALILDVPKIIQGVEREETCS